MSSLQEMMNRRVVEWLVGRNLGLCPVTQTAYNADTAVVFLDDDGDVTAAISPAHYVSLTPDQLDQLAATGYHIVDDTVPELFTVVGSTTVEVTE